MGVHEVVGVADAVDFVLELGVDMVGQGVPEHLTGHIIGVQLVERALPGAGDFHHLGIDHQLCGRGVGEGALGGQVGLGRRQRFPFAQRRHHIDGDVPVQGVGQRELGAVLAGVGDGVAAPDLHALVGLLEVAMGLAQLIRVRVAEPEGMIGIQAQLGALRQEAVGGGVHAQGFLRGTGSQGTGGEGRGQEGQGHAALSRCHGQLLQEGEEGSRPPRLFRPGRRPGFASEDLGITGGKKERK